MINTKGNNIDLVYMAQFLAILYIFILFTIRAFYFALIAKADPMRVTELTPKWLQKKINLKDAQDKARHIS